MRKVGIRKLKANLSAYVRRARAGEVVLVTDHGDVVAQLQQPDMVDSEAAVTRRYRDAVASGWLRPPSDAGNRSWIGDAGVKLRPGSVAALLDAERGDA